MSDEPALLANWGYGLVGLTYLVFALTLVRLGYLDAPRNRAHALVLLALIAQSVWGLLVLAAYWWDATPLPWLASLADHLRYGLWFAFLLCLLAPAKRGDVVQHEHQRTKTAPAAAMAQDAEMQHSARDGEVSVAMPPWSGIAIGLVVGATLADLLEVLQFNWFGDPARIAFLLSTALAVLGLMLLEQVWRNLPEDSRWNAKPLCLGLGGLFLFDLYLYSQSLLFGRLDADAATARGVVHWLVAPLLLLSFWRRRGWLARLRMSQKAAFHSATLLLAGVYLLFISAVGYYVRFFGGEWGRAAQLALVFAALVLLVMLTVSRTMRAALRVRLVKHFFSYRYDYRVEWLKFTRALSADQGTQPMGHNVIRGLADMVESAAGALWTRQPNDDTFRQVAQWNLPQVDEREALDGPLCKFLQRSGWVVDLAEFQAEPQRYSQMVLPQWLEQTPRAWLLVALLVEDELIGFVLLAAARTPIDVNWEIIDLLKTAARQAASFLARMQATEALLEARKFDAFNRMSAFVVHDLKNIVTQLSLMLRNAERLRDNPEFQQDMLETVEHSVERMRQLMLQLRDGAKPVGSGAGVELTAMAQRAAANARSRGRLLELELVDAVATRGQPDRIERIIGHLVQNAFDATEADQPASRVWLRLQRRAGQACIEVGDTGCGMAPEFLRERLFRPFQTTKEAGMGIGAYESFQYVRELGGTIDVESAPGAGTRVTIQLPLFELRHEPELHALETP